MNLVRPCTTVALLAVFAAACAETAAPPTSPTATTPQFIIGGDPTGAKFGNVGAVLTDFNDDGRIQPFDEWFCSGSLISPTVFLTAAHCLQFLSADAKVYVSFDPDMGAKNVSLVAAKSFHFDPQYGSGGQNDPHDIGVIVFKKAISGIQPLQLPPAGYLDGLNAKNGLANTLFLNVGYGGDATRTGQPHSTYDGVRKVSRSAFQNLEPAWLLLNMNTNATGEGGDCYGDSGGPKFIDGNPNMVVATVVTGDVPCRATSKDYRLDTQAARAFLADFVNPP
jgi:Trypsin